MLKELSSRGGPHPTRYLTTCEGCAREFMTLPSIRRRFCSYACSVPAKRQPLTQRFWGYVDKTDTCWLWTGAKNENGYGKIRADAPGTEFLGAHCVSWEIAKGTIPDGLWVLHNCPGGDNPSCVNPDHLFLGTNSDNIKDEIAKAGKSLRWRNR